MDTRDAARTLSPLERKVLPLIKEFPLQSMLIANAGLKDVEVVRAIQWLGNKGIITLKEDEKELVFLDENGKQYAKDGLPEKRFLHALLKRQMSLDEIAKAARLSPDEVKVAIGLLKKRLLIELSSEDKKTFIAITEQGKKALHKESLEEVFLKQDFPMEKGNVKDESFFALNELLKRKRLLKIEKVKEKTISLTQLGEDILADKALLAEASVERLTRDMLVSGAYKGKSFRAYDVSINVPKLMIGKKHFDNEALAYIKRIWLDMGFSEMTGNIVQTAFWDLDALYVPQDHPAREMQDTFYLKRPKVGRLPKDLLPKVAKMHEEGRGAESRGWRIPFDEEKSRQLLLRTHTTVLSAQTIARLKKADLPAKFFSVGKVFRNEATDWKHDFELYQVEGIVVDRNATLSHLKGYLQAFYKKMGYSDVRMRPAHFPYTEPSMEIEAYHPKRKEWVELGGSGIFRPEVTVPLMGEDVPVLAWGLGMARIISAYYELKDIRDIYRNNLDMLRNMKTWLMVEEWQ
ncbi:MAG: phenylalanine--tRNA ligase subunit alpha [Nanoarchaeota archaeon]